jgi:hypothetical protein
MIACRRARRQAVRRSHRKRCHDFVHLRVPSSKADRPVALALPVNRSLAQKRPAPSAPRRERRATHGR